MLSDKEAGSMPERYVLLLLHICGATEEDIHQYVVDWRKKTAENMKELRSMYGITLTWRSQVTFASPQPYIITRLLTIAHAQIYR